MVDGSRNLQVAEARESRIKGLEKVKHEKGQLEGNLGIVYIIKLKEILE
jgi:hypothetical protein